MIEMIKIKKGLDINLKGKASEVFLSSKGSATYALVPDCYTGIVPKVVVKPGAAVKAGSVLMIDKKRPEIKFVSPVSGEVTAVNRGAKRKILSIEVKPDATIEYDDFGKKNVASLSGEQVKEALLEGGMWPFLRQRPYDIVATPTDTPRDIFVTAYHTAPLAPAFSFIVKGEEENFKVGLEALAKLTEGNVYVGHKQGDNIPTDKVKSVVVEGPHPAGNVGVLINHLAPVNKGEVVWTINATDVILMGRLLNTGKADFARTVAITGSEVKNPGFVKAIAGCSIASLVDGNLNEGDKHLRLISGNVLTGTKVQKTDYLGAYDYQVTVIPEGDDNNEFFGWALPGLDKFSMGHTYFSWLAGKAREYIMDARLKGGKRAMIMSNEYDKVFPMDIYPEYLIKAIIAFDIDKMEALGIYEVAPEDFALCEFVDTSKIELQYIVRKGLDMFYKEMN